MHPAPQPSKEHLYCKRQNGKVRIKTGNWYASSLLLLTPYLASSVLWTVGLLSVRSHSSSLHEFKIFSNLNGTTSTVSYVIHDRLRRCCLRKGGLCSWKVTARSSLANAMFASESRAPNLPSLVTTNLISFRQATGLHLLKSQKEIVRNEIDIVRLYQREELLWRKRFDRRECLVFFLVLLFRPFQHGSLLPSSWQHASKSTKDLPTEAVVR